MRTEALSLSVVYKNALYLPATGYAEKHMRKQKKEKTNTNAESSYHANTMSLKQDKTKDNHTYELVGHEIRRDDGFRVRLAPIREEDRAWARAQIEEWKTQTPEHEERR